MAELPPIRRIVTTHDEQGVAIVQTDEHFEPKVCGDGEAGCEKRQYRSELSEDA